MKKQEAKNIVVELRILDYDAHLLSTGTHRRQYAVLLTGYGAFHRVQDYQAWKERIQEYPGGHGKGGLRND